MLLSAGPPMSILNFASGAGVASVTVSSPMSVAARAAKAGGGGDVSQMHGGGGGGRQLWARAAGAPTSTARVASADATIAERDVMSKASRTGPAVAGDVRHRRIVIHVAKQKRPPRPQGPLRSERLPRGDWTSRSVAAVKFNTSRSLRDVSASPQCAAGAVAPH